MRPFLALLLLLIGSVACAAATPQKITAVYAATRNGQPFATVTETYRQEGSRYYIESQTKGIGVYALFGVRRLASEGEVTTDGLKPKRFEQQQGDKKPVVAEFDWDGRKLTMTNKNKVSVADLEADTQDLASFAYQFMFRPPIGDEVIVPVTTGKRLRSYRYRVAGRGETLEGVLGGLKVVHLTNVATDVNDEKEFWLASEKYHLPAKIVMHEETGATIEQVLTSLSIE